jgi:hypothetical protein
VTFLHTIIFPTTVSTVSTCADARTGVVEALERARAGDTGKAANTITAIKAPLKRIWGSLIVFIRTILLGIVGNILDRQRNSPMKGM